MDRKNGASEQNIPLDDLNSSSDAHPEDDALNCDISSNCGTSQCLDVSQCSGDQIIHCPDEKGELIGGLGAYGSDIEIEAREEENAMTWLVTSEGLNEVPVRQKAVTTIYLAFRYNPGIPFSKDMKLPHFSYFDYRPEVA